MKFTLSWLHDFLESDASLEQISTALTALGLEVESIENPAERLSAFTVAEILEATPHPDADRLRVCRVQSDSGELQIVCGAPNARAGIKVALAKEGAMIPNGEFVIKKSKIRGVESCGMLCSSRELNLGEDHDGIMELPEHAAIGEPIAKALGLDDPLIEIAITPNRGDCLGVYGIARDLAAAGLGTLKPLPTIELAMKGASPITIKLEQDNPCRQFIGRVITGVQNGPAPEWMQKRLLAIGLRPISALVDITNYINMSYGRPLHVYDLDKLKGGIVARSAQPGEMLAALNDKSYTLEGGECVIADESGVLGLGGIVGGIPSSVTEETTNIVLECAWFEPISIAETGRKHSIDTDARYRFERGVDPAFIETGEQLAANMILQLCGGMACQPVIAGSIVDTRQAIEISAEKLTQLGGISLSRDEQMELLTRLGCAVEALSAESYSAMPPSWRPDITMQADLVEELLRIYGYDRVPLAPLPKIPHVQSPALIPQQERVAQIRHLLAGAGCHEAHSWAFCSTEEAEMFGGVNEGLMLQNPISSDLSIMRPSLLPHLLTATSKNLARSRDRVALFEVGPQFDDAMPGSQQLIACSIRAGLKQPSHWQGKAQEIDAYQAKSDAEAMIALAGISAETLQISPGAPAWYHPGRSGAFMLGPKKILAYFGEIHPHILEHYDIKERVAACEVFIDNLPVAKKKKSALKVSDYQPVRRDFAFLVNSDIAAVDLLQAIRRSDKELIRQVEIFDVYAGEHIEKGTKSIAISTLLQSDSHTLAEAEIEATAQKIITAASQLGAKLRA